MIIQSIKHTSTITSLVYFPSLPHSCNSMIIHLAFPYKWVNVYIILFVGCLLMLTFIYVDFKRINNRSLV